MPTEIGRTRRRPEDRPLLAGEAAFTDDLATPESLFMGVVRSQYGHGRVDAVDAGAAEAVDGVVAVLTAADLADVSGTAGIPTYASLHGVDDPDVPAAARVPLSVPHRPLLAADRVRYAGEPVAVVLAEDRYACRDGVTATDLDVERLPAVVDPDAATDADAPTLHEDVPENLAFDWAVGDAGAVEEAFDRADHAVDVQLADQRISPVPIEPRAAFARHDADGGGLTLYTATQDPYSDRRAVCDALGLPPADVRVVTPEVGGGFGCKSKWYPAELLAAWCAIRTGRPVSWQATRSESLAADMHGRARTVRGELAFDADGTLRGIRADSTANLGAYLARGAPSTRTGSFADALTGQYAIPSIHCRVRGVFTNTSPVGSFRGSSRVQTILLVERLLDRAAAELGVDPASLRRANFIDPAEFPYRTPLGDTYDSGEYERALDAALERVGYETLRDRQARLRERGRYLGVGLSCVVDSAGTSSPESARIVVHPDGSATAYCGTAEQGQGHRTTFAQLVADQLGLPFEAVTVREGDTADLEQGGGAVGSRSVVVGGEALRSAAGEVVERARAVAAGALEVAAEDLAFVDGRFNVRGAPERSIHLREVADRTAAGDESAEGLVGSTTGTTPGTYPFGTHVAVVEVDPATGEVDLERYVAVDDCGVQINPALVEGQVVGGVVAGIGQALLEEAVYDGAGTLRTGSLQDYALPRAADTPAIETGHTETPSPFTPLGVKGAGESGTTAAPAAVCNAVVDALAPFGVEHLDPPMTPETVWRAMGRAGGSPD